MDYKKHYQCLIQKARLRKLTDYHETHHIIPKCLGGSDNPNNLVNLTPEEHYVAHQLLTKIYSSNPSLISAAMMMCAKRKGNKVYGWLRRQHARAMSIHQSGENNSQYGTIWVYKDNTTQKISKKVIDQYVSIGWKLGRKAKKEKLKKEKISGIDSEKYKWIAENEQEILNEFDEIKSVTKILQKRGFKNREGNRILSKWLKSKGRTILKRRNSAGVA